MTVGRVCDFLLIGWWWGNRVMLSLKLPSSTSVGALVPTEELKGIVMCIPSGGTRILPQGCTIVSWLLLLCFCIPPLPWLATVWICPLELREGPGGWMKPISYKQEMGDMERLLCPRAPQGPAQFPGCGLLAATSPWRWTFGFPAHQTLVLSLVHHECSIHPFPINSRAHNS